MVEELKYLGTTLTFQNFIQEDIEQTDLRKCLLSFGAELFVFKFPVQKSKE